MPRPITTWASPWPGVDGFDEAIAHYQEALEIEPNDADAHNNLGLALAGRGQIDEAMAQYHEALKIRPDFAEAHINLGLALAGRGRYRRGDGPVPEDLGNQAPLRRGPHRFRHRFRRPADESTKRSRTCGRPCKSSPTTPKPTTTWGLSWRAGSGLTRRSSTSKGPWKSSPITPWPIKTWASFWPGGDGWTRR